MVPFQREDSFKSVSDRTGNGILIYFESNFSRFVLNVYGILNTSNAISSTYAVDSKIFINCYPFYSQGISDNIASKCFYVLNNLSALDVSLKADEVINENIFKFWVHFQPNNAVARRYSQFMITFPVFEFGGNRRMKYTITNEAMP